MTGVQTCALPIYLLFLVIFDMPAHDDDGLPHEKEEETADESQHQQGDPADRHFIPKGRVPGIENADEFPDQDIVIDGVFGVGGRRRADGDGFAGSGGSRRGRHRLRQASGDRGGFLAGDVSLQLLVDGIDHISRYLRREDTEIVGQDDKYKAQQEPPAVFPEILV